MEAILIAGPTASGKSAIALTLAQAVGGAIINADSMQVYGDLRILTARPMPAEEAGVPHCLYGHMDGGDAYSVGRWVADVAGVLSGVREAGLVPIIVGGTGLYHKALLDGLSPIPEIPAAVRTRWRDTAEDMAAEALHARLAQVDPDTAAVLSPRDPQRLVRALEVFDATGRSLRSWQSEAGDPLLVAARCRRIFLDPDREWLCEKINRRFDMMMAMGALEEVAALRQRCLSPTLPVMRAHGVPHLTRYLGGEIGLSCALDRGKADVRQYAKRQKTWFRNQMAGWEAIPPERAQAWIDTVAAT